MAGLHSVLLTFLLNFTPPPKLHSIVLISLLLLDDETSGASTTSASQRPRAEAPLSGCLPAHKDQNLLQGLVSSTSADPPRPPAPLQDAGRRLRGLDDQHTEKQTATSTSAPAERPAGFYAAHLLPAGRSLRGSRVHLFLLHRGLENLLVLRGTGHFITERAEQGRAGQGGGEGWRRRLRQDGGGNNSEEAELVSRGRHPISREVLEKRKRVL